MEKTYFYAGLAGTLLTAGLAGAMINTEQGLAAGILALLSLGLIRYVASESRKSGRTDDMKILLSLTSIVFELLLVTGAVLVDPVPKELAVGFLGTLMLVEVFRLDIRRLLNQSFELSLGQETRVLVIAVSCMAYFFNPYYLFYGVLFALVIAVYDFVYLVARAFDQ